MRTAVNRELDWRLLLLAVLLGAAILGGRSFYHAGLVPLLGDTDDAMRLVVVRDLLAGQGWYDHVQHRLNTPFGAELHWSRLADLPVAGLVLLLQPLAGADAGRWAAWLWPLLLLLPLLWLTAAITLRLVGREGLLPALLLPLFSLATLGEFAPGRIDHHNLQMLLLLALLWCCLVALQRPRFGWAAGIAAATALAIGIEGLPGVAAAILALGLSWVLEPRHAAALRNFGAGFGLATLIHLALALPPERWLQPACDALSLTYAAAAAGSGALLVALSLLPLTERPAWLRLAAGALAGLGLLLVLALLFPECRDGPYGAVDPLLRAQWIDRIAEAMPLWASLADNPAHTVGLALPPLLALLVTGWRLRRGGPGGAEWLVYALFLVVAVLVMLLQVRGARMAMALAPPAGALLILAARRHYSARPGLARAPLLLGGWIGFAGVAVLVVVRSLLLLAPASAGTGDGGGEGSREQCLLPAAYAGLAALPPARIMAPIDLGAHLLAYTPHAVVAAPYHRNQQGVRDAFAFFGGPLEAARGLLAARGIDYVVTCAALPELAPGAAAEGSIIARLDSGALPEWLVERDLDAAPLRVFEVVR